MAPSFAPKESRRKKDARPPREPDLADAIVEKIKKDYAEQMRERGLVDSKGEPTKKHNTIIVRGDNIIYVSP